MHFCIHQQRKVYFLHTHPVGKYMEHNCRGNERQSFYNFSVLKENAHRFKCSTLNLFVLNIKKVTEILLVCDNKSKLLSTGMYVLFYSYTYKWWWYYDCWLIKYLSFKGNFAERFEHTKIPTICKHFPTFANIAIEFCGTLVWKHYAV